eukprot:8553958-Pyramimonas_sp.AAC.1
MGGSRRVLHRLLDAHDNSDSITSFYGSSCANNGKDALSTPQLSLGECVSLHEPRGGVGTGGAVGGGSATLR